MLKGEGLRRAGPSASKGEVENSCYNPGSPDGRRNGGGGPDRHTDAPVPFTLQVLAVILSGLLLGSRHGALAQAVYLLVGVVGVPVFAEFSGGLGVILGPTGGT